jgi:hypothetical protein
MEQQELRPEIGIQTDSGAYTRLAGFGKRYREPPIAQVMRGFGQAGAHDFADSRLHALFARHVERRRQTP